MLRKINALLVISAFLKKVVNCVCTRRLVIMEKALDDLLLVQRVFYGTKPHFFGLF